MKKILFIYCILQVTIVLSSELFNINTKLLSKQVNDFFTTFIEEKRNENSIINVFIEENEDNFEIYLDKYKIKTKNKVLSRSNTLDFIFERNLLQTTTNDLYDQAKKIDIQYDNTLIQDFLSDIAELENEF